MSSLTGVAANSGTLTPSTNTTPGSLTPVSVGTVGPAGPQGIQGLPGIAGPSSAVPGPIGPQGIQGIQGLSGAMGLPGTNGNTIISSNGTPSNTVGNNGDYFYDTNGHVLWGPKASNAWPPTGIPLVGPIGPSGVQGSVGPMGLAGNSILNGTAVPGGTVGQNGDFYINTSNSTIYGPKASGAWPSNGISLYGATGPAGPQGAASTVAGPTGPAGTSIQTGSGAPSNTVGNNGDIYYDYTNYNLYGAKTSGSWPTTYKNLVGPQGSVGQTGASGTAGTNGTNGSNGYSILNGTSNPTASNGNNGDFFLNTSTTTLFGPKASGAWPSTGTSLVGPQGQTGQTGAASTVAGPQGASGANGTNGNTIQNGSGAPASTLGANGDYYIDNTNYRLYGPKASGSWPTTYQSLIGPMGAQGTQGSAGTAGTAGTNGNTVLNGTILPSASVGNNGDFYLRTDTDVLFGPKASGAWPSTGVSLIGQTGAQGPAGAAGTIPNDFTPNSVVIAPISGDTNTVQLLLNDSSGNQQFAVSNAGALVAKSAAISGNATVGGTLGVTGASTLAGVSVTSSQNSGNETISGTLGVTGTTTAAAINATNIAASGTLAVTGASTVAGMTNSGQYFATTGGGATPGYAFTGDTNTGMWRSAAGTWAMTAAGITNLTGYNGGLSSSKTFTSTTAAGTPSFVSSQGFRQSVFMGGANFSGNATAGAAATFTIYASSAVAIAYWIAPFAGSVLNISATNTTLASNLQLQLWNNGSVVSTFAPTFASNTNGPGGVASATVAKGAYTFTAGQALYFRINQTNTTTTSYSGMGHMLVEMSA